MHPHPRGTASCISACQEKQRGKANQHGTYFRSRKILQAVVILVGGIVCAVCVVRARPLVGHDVARSGAIRQKDATGEKKSERGYLGKTEKQGAAESSTSDRSDSATGAQTRTGREEAKAMGRKQLPLHVVECERGREEGRGEGEDEKRKKQLNRRRKGAKSR